MRALYEQFRCRPTNDFAVAVCSDHAASALVTDDYGFAWRETSTLAEALEVSGPEGRPPLGYHALHREGRLTWVHPRRDSQQLALARVFRFDEFDYAADSMEMAVALGFRGAPILFAAVADGASGVHQVDRMREAGLGMVQIRRVSVLDLRGAHSRTQDPRLRRFGEAHPILDLDIADSALGEAS